MRLIVPMMLMLAQAGCSKSLPDGDDSAEDEASAEAEGATATSQASGEEDAGFAGFAPTGGMMGPDVGPVDSHDEDMNPIWAKNCVIYCHGGDTVDTTEGLDLDRMAAYDAIVNVPAVQLPSMMLVAPGQPDASYLWHKVQNTHLAVGGDGVAMPKDQPALDPEELDRIETWILDGCPP